MLINEKYEGGHVFYRWVVAFATDAENLVVDREHNRLYVMLHHSNFAHVDKIIRELFKKLNKTQSVMPGSDLTLYYQLVSEKKPE